MAEKGRAQVRSDVDEWRKYPDRRCKDGGGRLRVLGLGTPDFGRAHARRNAPIATPHKDAGWQPFEAQGKPAIPDSR